MNTPDSTPQRRKPAVTPDPATAAASPTSPPASPQLPSIAKSSPRVKVTSPITIVVSPAVVFRAEKMALPMLISPMSDEHVRYVVHFEAEYQPGNYKLAIADVAGVSVIHDGRELTCTILRGGTVGLEWSAVGRRCDPICVWIEDDGDLRPAQLAMCAKAVLERT